MGGECGENCCASRLEGWESAEDGEGAAIKFMHCIEMKLFKRRVLEVSRMCVRCGEFVDLNPCRSVEVFCGVSFLGTVTTQQKEFCVHILFAIDFCQCVVGIWDDLWMTHSGVCIETERDVLEYAKYRFHNDNDNLNRGMEVLSTNFARLPSAKRSNQYLCYNVMGRVTRHT